MTVDSLETRNGAAHSDYEIIDCELKYFLLGWQCRQKVHDSQGSLVIRYHGINSILIHLLGHRKIILLHPALSGYC